MYFASTFRWTKKYFCIFDAADYRFWNSDCFECSKIPSYDFGAGKWKFVGLMQMYFLKYKEQWENNFQGISYCVQ